MVRQRYEASGWNLDQTASSANPGPIARFSKPECAPDLQPFLEPNLQPSPW
jgi:hypothetical protein